MKFWFMFIMILIVGTEDEIINDIYVEEIPVIQNRHLTESEGSNPSASKIKKRKWGNPGTIILLDHYIDFNKKHISILEKVYVFLFNYISTILKLIYHQDIVNHFTVFLLIDFSLRYINDDLTLNGIYKYECGCN